MLFLRNLFIVQFYSNYYMHSQNNKNKILEFIKSKKIGILATISPKGKPEAAVVEYVATDKLEIIFNTFSTYRKYKNLKHNPNVAFVIGWDEISVQYQGHAIEAKGNLEDLCKKIHSAKIKHKTKFSAMPTIRYFKIKPRWIRYIDYSKKPWEVFEVSF